MRNWHPMYDAAYPPITEVTGGFGAFWDAAITPTDYGVTVVDGQTRVVLPPVSHPRLIEALDLVGRQHGAHEADRRIYAGDVAEDTARTIRAWITYQKHGCEEASAYFQIDPDIVSAPTPLHEDAFLCEKLEQAATAAVELGIPQYVWATFTEDIVSAYHVGITPPTDPQQPYMVAQPTGTIDLYTKVDEGLPPLSRVGGMEKYREIVRKRKPQPGDSPRVRVRKLELLLKQYTKDLAQAKRNRIGKGWIKRMEQNVRDTEAALRNAQQANEADTVSVATIMESVAEAAPLSDPDRPLAKTFTQFHHHGNVFRPAGPGVFAESLGRSAYRIVSSMSGIEFHRTKAKTDELYHFKDSVMENVIEKIDKFWSLKEDYAQMGVLHNRGILLEGKPGTGKSSAIQQVVEMMVKRGDVVFFANNIRALKGGLKAFREVEETRPVVVVLEDADEHLKYEQNSFLQLLDGDEAFEGVLYLATTNYLDRFPERLKRPGRFDEIVNVPPPPEAGRYLYLKNKIGEHEDDKELKRLANATEGMSFCHLREFVMAVYAFKEDKATTLNRVRASTGIGLHESLLSDPKTVKAQRFLVTFGRLELDHRLDRAGMRLRQALQDKAVVTDGPVTPTTGAFYVTVPSASSGAKTMLTNVLDRMGYPVGQTVEVTEDYDPNAMRLVLDAMGLIPKTLDARYGLDEKYTTKAQPAFKVFVSFQGNVADAQTYHAKLQADADKAPNIVVSPRKGSTFMAYLGAGSEKQARQAVEKALLRHGAIKEDYAVEAVATLDEATIGQVKLRTELRPWWAEIHTNDAQEAKRVTAYFTKVHRVAPGLWDGAPVVSKRPAHRGKNVVLLFPNAKDHAEAKRTIQSELLRWSRGVPVDESAIVVYADDTVSEVSPPGFSGTVKAMKDEPGIGNPYALAWHMYQQGAKPHKATEPGKPRYVTPETYAKRKAERLGEVRQSDATAHYRRMKKLWDRLQREFPDWPLGDLKDAAQSVSPDMSREARKVQQRFQALRKQQEGVDEKAKPGRPKGVKDSRRGVQAQPGRTASQNVDEKKGQYVVVALGDGETPLPKPKADRVRNLATTMGGIPDKGRNDLFRFRYEDRPTALQFYRKAKVMVSEDIDMTTDEARYGNPPTETRQQLGRRLGQFWYHTLNPRSGKGDPEQARKALLKDVKKHMPDLLKRAGVPDVKVTYSIKATMPAARGGAPMLLVRATFKLKGDLVMQASRVAWINPMGPNSYYINADTDWPMDLLDYLRPIMLKHRFGESDTVSEATDEYVYEFDIPNDTHPLFTLDKNGKVTGKTTYSGTGGSMGSTDEDFRFTAVLSGQVDRRDWKVFLNEIKRNGIDPNKVTFKASLTMMDEAYGPKSHAKVNTDAEMYAYANGKEINLGQWPPAVTLIGKLKVTKRVMKHPKHKLKEADTVSEGKTPKGAILSKGVWYWKRYDDAKAWAQANNWPTDRIIAYQKGYGVQAGKSGNYAGPGEVPTPWKGMAQMKESGDIVSEGTMPPWAKTILQQIGGNRALMMMGVKGTRLVPGVLYSEQGKYVQLHIGRNSSGGQWLTITYRPGMDLYDIKIDSRRGTKLKIKHEAKGVYADQLVGWIEGKTGLYLSMGSMRRESVDEARRRERPAIHAAYQAGLAKFRTLLRKEGYRAAPGGTAAAYKAGALRWSKDIKADTGLPWGQELNDQTNAEEDRIRVVVTQAWKRLFAGLVPQPGPSVGTGDGTVLVRVPFAAVGGMAVKESLDERNVGPVLMIGGGVTPGTTGSHYSTAEDAQTIATMLQKGLQGLAPFVNAKVSIILGEPSITVSVSLGSPKMMLTLALTNGANPWRPF
jgi:hypothetical protein